MGLCVGAGPRERVHFRADNAPCLLTRVQSGEAPQVPLCPELGVQGVGSTRTACGCLASRCMNHHPEGCALPVRLSPGVQGLNAASRNHLTRHPAATAITQQEPRLPPRPGCLETLGK